MRWQQPSDLVITGSQLVSGSFYTSLLVFHNIISNLSRSQFFYCYNIGKKCYYEAQKRVDGDDRQTVDQVTLVLGSAISCSIV